MLSQRLITSLLFAVSLCVTGVTHGQQNDVADVFAHYVLDPSQRLRIANPDYVAFKEPTTLDSVLASSAWKSYSNRESFLPGQYKAIWYRFSVQATDAANQTWWLSLNWSMVNSAQLHIFNTTQKTWRSTRPVGTRYSLSDRYRDSLYFDFPLDLEDDAEHILYLSIESSNILSVPLFVSTDKQLTKHYTTEKFLIGALFGCLAIMFVYNLSLAALLTDRNYYYYCFFIASILLYQLSASGVGTYYLWDSSLFLKQKAFVLFGCLGFLGASVFIVKFLDLENFSKPVRIGARVTILVWIVLLFLSIPFTHASWLSHAINAISFWIFFAGLVLGSILSLRGNISAKIFMLSWSVLMIGTSCFMLAIFGKLRLTIFTQYSQMFGFVVEMALLSFALAYRINIHRLRRDAAQKNALVLAAQVSTEREQRLQAQKESLDMQTKLNQELEEQVKERTIQLESAMEKLENANIELTNLSNTDALSNTYNRRYFDTIFSTEYGRAHRSKQPLALILIDIDHFKSVNDSYGHSVGDRCIQVVAKSLSEEAKRPGDILARYGGEEFVLLLPAVNVEMAATIAEQCRQRVAQLEVETQDLSVHLTVSCGVAAWVPNQDADSQTLIDAADSALYEAKHLGRNRVVASPLTSDTSNVSS
ncbi:sensor domain-containing diguanylate cyclase [Aurantivibrio plasticivorans]